MARRLNSLKQRMGKAACLAVLLCGPAAFAGENVNIPDTSALIPDGWREAVVSVRDLEAMATFYQRDLGWELRSTGPVPAATLKAWGLPSAARARFALVANANTDRGFVRILEFNGVPQQRIRSHDQAWETGGIYNMNIRVADMAATAAKVTDAGWQGPSDPVQFSFGPFVVQEWIPRHTDGVRIAFVGRVKPPLQNWPNLK
ncbi:MAG: VOC family protein, partial [Pseudomonadota bacterium]